MNLDCWRCVFAGNSSVIHDVRESRMQSCWQHAATAF
jgi:hypothetical protein